MRKFKGTALLLLSLCFTITALAQTYPITGITIKLPPNPDAKTNNWSAGVSMLTINASTRLVNGKIDGHVQESKLLVTITKNGVKICGSYTQNSAPASNFNAATKVWSGSNAVSLLGQECNLPPGEYELTVQFFGSGVAGLVPLSEEKSKPFSIRGAEQQAYQPPQAITPANGKVFTEAELQRPVMFSWTPLVPKPTEPFVYRLKVWQLMHGQNGTQAMRTNNPVVTKDVENLTQTTVNNLLTGPCMPPYLCDFIWTVQALNREGKPIGRNNGTSEPGVFFGSVTGNQNLPPAVDSGTAIVGDSIRAGLNGEFTVIVTDVTIETDGSLTGKGKVRIPWLKTYIAVEFKKIRIDTTRRLTSGGIVSTESGSTASSYLDYPKAWALSLLSGPGVANAADISMNWTNNLVNNLVGWVNNVAPGSQPLINYNDTIPTPAIPNNTLKMPFGLVFKNSNDFLVITEIIFKSNESKINFLAQKLFTKGVTDYKLGFAGKYFKIHPTSIDFTTGRVELVEDIKIPNTSSNPKMKFNFKKGTANSGCYIVWDSTGVKDISLGLEVKFSRDWLLPIPTSTDSVIAIISGNGTSMQDILLTGSLPHCEIVGTNGFKVLADSISLDLSDLRNPGSIHFPENYLNDSTVTWQGFYIKSFGLTLPDTWKTGATLNLPIVTASNIIIDDMGLTAKIKAVNVFDLQSGRVADLSASLDTVEVSIINSSLVSGTAKGLLVLPISEVTAQNSLKYTATFAQVAGANNFQIVIVPLGPIDADILKGKMTLSQTSNITAGLSANIKTVAINLNGSFQWGDKDLAVTDTTTATGGAPIRKKGIKGIKMEMDFQNLSLAYTNNSVANTNTMSFNPGTWNFASPPKFLANFPVTIKKIYYKSLTKVSPELVRGALMIDIVANLTDNIGGTTTVGAAFAIELNMSAKKFIPKYKGVFIEDISVYADMPAVKIDGKLKMYDNDPTYGDGFLANLGVTFTAVSLQINALVQFGNTVYNNNNQYYRYWRVEADVKLPVGIPFLTGIGFYGFGGGAFYNMTPKEIQSIAVPGSTKFTFEPKKSALGFVVKATIATMPKFETCNMDVELLAVFSNSGGLIQIGFLGNFWLAAKLNERDASNIKGSVVAGYNFPDKLFNMTAGLLIKVPADGSVIKTVNTSGIGFVMKIDGSTNKWYFKAGTPNVPGEVEVFGIGLYSYFMFGNDLAPDVPTGFTPKFIAGYSDAIGGTPTVGSTFGSGGVGDNTATGKGIATGIGIKFDQTFNESIWSGPCRDWDINASLKAGAELNLAFLEYSSCGSLSSFGINNYRASGSVGLYFSLTSSITGTSKCYGIDDKNYNLFTIKTGAWLSGQFPNPVFLNGYVGGQISLFDGAINKPWSKYFEYGTNCSGTAVVTADAAQEDEADSVRNKLIQYVAPNTRYNFPVASTINAKYALVPDRVFDVAENQGDGTIKNRTFKLVITRSLEVQNTDGTWSVKALLTKLNNLGEYQYYLTAPSGPIRVGPITQGSSQLAPLAPSIATSLNTNNGNTLIARNRSFNFNSIPSPVPPPPAPNYPNPVPNPVNQLVADKEYRFKVTAALMEFGINVVAGQGRGSGTTTEPTWAPAKTRAGIAVTETKTVLFRTGSMPVAQVSTIAPRSR